MGGEFNKAYYRYKKNLFNFMFRRYSLLILIISLGCSKQDDCTKTVVIPEHMIGNAYYPEQRLEAPCDFPEAEPIGNIEVPIKDKSKILIEL